MLHEGELGKKWNLYRISKRTEQDLKQHLTCSSDAVNADEAIESWWKIWLRDDGVANIESDKIQCCSSLSPEDFELNRRFPQNVRELRTCAKEVKPNKRSTEKEGTESTKKNKTTRVINIMLPS